MANLSYLYELSSKRMPLDDQDHLRATGRYFIPLFWLATFEKTDIDNFVDEEGNNLPYLHVNVNKAIDTFENNKQTLDKLSKDLHLYYKEWIEILQNMKSKYIAVDPTEIIFMVNTDYYLIHKAIQFFVEPTSESFDALFHLTSFPVILDGKEIREYAVVDGNVTQIPASEYLIGCAEEENHQVQPIPKKPWWKVWQ